MLSISAAQMIDSNQKQPTQTNRYAQTDVGVDTCHIHHRVNDQKRKHTPSHIPDVLRFQALKYNALIDPRIDLLPWLNRFKILLSAPLS
jgi:hypothetical protein